jgi:hypothetical protein
MIERPQYYKKPVVSGPYPVRLAGGVVWNVPKVTASHFRADWKTVYLRFADGSVACFTTKGQAIIPRALVPQVQRLLSGTVS